MQYTATYDSPLGKLLLVGDEDCLTNLRFLPEKSFSANVDNETVKETPVFAETERWLDIYFSGVNPDFMPKLRFIGTPFRRKVWQILLKIPYGEVVTYGDIAKELVKNGGKMSAQAVGGAVGHNDIPIIVPCHRVIGANGNLVGYTGGMDKKTALLRLEGFDTEKFKK